MNYLFKKVHQSAILLGLVFGVIIGTILSFTAHLVIFDSFAWIIVIFILFLLSYLYPTRFFVVIIFLAGIMLSNYRFTLEQKNSTAVDKYIGEIVELTGKVASDPTLSGSNTTMKLDYNHASLYVQVYMPKTLEIKRGDSLTLKGKLSDGFGIYSASMFRPELLKIARPTNNFLISLRDNFAENIKNSLSSDESSLGLAYLLGLRNGLSDEIIEILSIVGLTHIVVASGTHLSVIIEFMRKIFGKVSRFAGLIFSILLIICFSELIGWTASITRAAIVSILSLSAWYIGKKVNPGRIILFSMAITLLLDPTNLTNLGWLLSFGSYSGILILSPILTKFFYGKKEPGFIAKILLATISATLMTAPILLYYFGSISLISLLANLLILPTIPLAMGFTFATGIVSFLPKLATAKLISSIVVKFTTIILDYHLAVLRFFGDKTMFLIKIEPENPFIFLFYIPITLLILLPKIRKFRARRLAPKRIPVYLKITE